LRKNGENNFRLKNAVLLEVKKETKIMKDLEATAHT